MELFWPIDPAEFSAHRHVSEWDFNNWFLYLAISASNSGFIDRFCCSQFVRKGVGNRPEPRVRAGQPFSYSFLCRSGATKGRLKRSSLASPPPFPDSNHLFKILLPLPPLFSLKKQFRWPALPKSLPWGLTCNITHVYQLILYQQQVTGNAQGWTKCDYSKVSGIATLAHVHISSTNAIPGQSSFIRFHHWHIRGSSQLKPQNLFFCELLFM